MIWFDILLHGIIGIWSDMVCMTAYKSTCVYERVHTVLKLDYYSREKGSSKVL